MVFIINDSIYDTDKMEVISEKCEYVYKVHYAFLKRELGFSAKDVKLLRSKKGRWLLTYKKVCGYTYAREMAEEKSKEILKRFDYEKYEELFGALEEA